MPETINIFIFKLLVFSIQSHPPNINHPFTQISVYKLHKTMFFLGGCFILVEQTLHPLLCPFLFDHIEVSWNSGTPKPWGFNTEMVWFGMTWGYSYLRIPPFIAIWFFSTFSFCLSCHAPSRMPASMLAGSSTASQWNFSSVPGSDDQPPKGFLKQISRHGYGSIPIDTIFSGMNIHLLAILMFTRGTRVLTHPHIVVRLKCI